MSTIPEEFTAAHGLEIAFRELALRSAPVETPAPPEPAATPRRAPVRRLPMRRVLVLAALVTLGVATVAGSKKVFVGGHVSLKGDVGAKVNIKRVAPELVLAEATAADPSGGLQWGMRAYPSSGGGRCVVAGQVRNGVLGVFARGSFAAVPATAEDACGSAGEPAVIATRRSVGGASRSVLFGQVDRTVSSVKLVGKAGASTIPIADDGSFLLVRAGATAFHGDTLVMTTPSGPQPLPVG